MTDTITLPRAVIEQSLEFTEFLWRDVHLNDYASAKLDVVMDTLRAALAQQAEQEWIDASKQMPPAQVRVLGFDPMSGIIDVDMWFGPDFQWGYSYWMPLPTPPKGVV